VSLAPLPPRNFAPPPCYEYWFWKIKKKVYGVVVASSGIPFIPASFCENQTTVLKLEMRTYTRARPRLCHLRSPLFLLQEGKYPNNHSFSLIPCQYKSSWMRYCVVLKVVIGDSREYMTSFFKGVEWWTLNPWRCSQHVLSKGREKPY